MVLKSLRTVFICSLLLQSAFFAFGQSTYKLSPAGDIALLTFGAGLTSLGYHFGQRLEPLELPEIQSLDPNRVNFLDRFAINQSSEASAGLSDVVLISSFMLPAFYLLDDVPSTEYLKLGVMGTETVLLTAGITLSVKNWAQRVRPYAYNPSIATQEKLVKDARRSFFSGHTSMSSAASFFVLSTFNQLSNDQGLKRAMTYTAISLPAVIGGLRVTAGKHFLSDVLIGYLVGATVGLTIPYLHQKTDGVQVTPSASGITIKYQF